MTHFSYTDEQRRKVLDVFSDGFEFYLYKELEQKISGQNITPNQLKQIMNDLLCVKTIECDKISGAMIYWLPAEKKYEEDKKKTEELKAKNRDLNDQILHLKMTLKKKEEARMEPTAENLLKREKFTNEMLILKIEEGNLVEYVQMNESANSQENEKMTTGIKMLVPAINRWTDNIFNMKSWFKRKFPALLDENLEQEFNIPPELDYFSLD